MTTLELEIIEKFHRLEPDAKVRLLETLTVDVQATVTQPPFDYAVWRAEVMALQAEFRSALADGETMGVQAMLDELREEESSVNATQFT